MDGPRNDYTKYVREEKKQISYDITYMWNIKKWYNAIIPNHPTLLQLK